MSSWLNGQRASASSMGRGGRDRFETRPTHDCHQYYLRCTVRFCYLMLSINSSYSLLAHGDGHSP